MLVRRKMSRYHRNLNLSNCVPNVDFSQWNTDGYRWSEFHKILKLEELNNSKFLNFLRSLNMTSYWIEVFYTPPKEDGVIHSDNTESKDWAKIVFQYGAKGSTMRWWTSDKTFDISTSLDQNSKDKIPEIKKISTKDRTYHGRILVSYEKDAKLEYEAEIGSASLINVGPLHSSHNPTDQKRFVITVALFDFDGNRILWDDALVRLSPYVKEN
jgi:hypothetical protein